MPWGKVEIFFHSIYRRWLCVIHKVPTPPNLFLKYLYSDKTNEEWVTEVQRQMVSGKQSYGHLSESLLFVLSTDEESSKTTLQVPVWTPLLCLPSVPSKQDVSRKAHLLLSALVCISKQTPAWKPFQKHTMQISSREEIEHAKN